LLALSFAASDSVAGDGERRDQREVRNIARTATPIWRPRAEQTIAFGPRLAA